MPGPTRFKLFYRRLLNVGIWNQEDACAGFISCVLVEASSQRYSNFLPSTVLSYARPCECGCKGVVGYQVAFGAQAFSNGRIKYCG